MLLPLRDLSAIIIYTFQNVTRVGESKIIDGTANEGLDRVFIRLYNSSGIVLVWKTRRVRIIDSSSNLYTIITTKQKTLLLLSITTCLNHPCFIPDNLNTK